MARYRPTAQARMQLRLDEGPDIASLKGALEREPAGNESVVTPSTEEDLKKAQAQNRANKEQLGRNRSLLPPGEFEKQQAVLDAESRAFYAARFAGQANTVEKGDWVKSNNEDERNVLFSSLPISCSVERTSVREPDTAEVVFDYKDLPIDPRSIRAGLITLTIGSVSDEDYRAGLIDRTTGPDGMLVSIVERRPNEELLFQGTRNRFVGFIDEWNIELGDDGDTVVLTMRDITALLLDQKLPPGVGIDLTLPLDDGIRQFINIFPSTRNLEVFFGTPMEFEQQKFNPSPKKAPIPRDSLPEVMLSRGGKKAKAKRKGDREDNVWDHIITTALKLGYIAFMRGFVLFIVEPRNLFRQASTSRKMVFGRNVSKLEFSRKLNGITTQTIEARSPNPDIGRTLWARYPVLDGEPDSGILGDPKSPQPVVSRPQKVSPSGQSDEHVHVVSIAGVTDLEVLRRIAENTHEEMARQEIEGSFETDEMDSFKQTESEEKTFGEEDLLNLYPGDSVTMLYAPPNDVSGSYQQTEKEGKVTANTAQDFAAMSFARRSDYLSSVGISKESADRLAAVAEEIPFANTFRVGTMNLNFDVEEGVSVACSFYNFIAIRETGKPDNAGVTEPQKPASMSQVADEV